MAIYINKEGFGLKLSICGSLSAQGRERTCESEVRVRFQGRYWQAPLAHAHVLKGHTWYQVVHWLRQFHVPSPMYYMNICSEIAFTEDETHEKYLRGFSLATHH